MRESVGYTVTLNIVYIFIIVIFTFLSAALIYYKSNKVSNAITETIEKYEGYNVNKNSQKEINSKLISLGYNRKSVNCEKYYNSINQEIRQSSCTSELNIKDNKYGLTDGKDGYCVFICDEVVDGENYYYYKISTNLMLNIPIVNEMLDIPIFSNTNRLFDFKEAFKDREPIKTVDEYLST